MAVPVLVPRLAPHCCCTCPARPRLGVACAAGLVAVNTALVRRRPALFGVLTWAGSGLPLFGNIAWAVGRPIFDVVPNWIASPRADPRRRAPALVARRMIPRWATHVLALLTTAFGLAAFMRMLGVGAASQVLGATALLLAVWRIRFDIARHALAQSGGSQYIALGVLAGMAWLAFAGSLFVLRPLPPAGPLYDAMLHAVLVGYVFSTLFAHAKSTDHVVGGRGDPRTVHAVPARSAGTAARQPRRSRRRRPE